MFIRLFFVLLIAIINIGAFNARSQDFKTITFNIRQDLKSDGINKWENRRKLMTQFLESSDCDIVCMQEVLNRQLLAIISDMPIYNYVGVGREDGKTKGEYSPILYKKDIFDLIDSGTFALSETPDSIGSLGWDARYSRIATWANLKFKESEEVVFVINTHLDNIGKMAKVNGMRLILDTIPHLAKSEHVILTGDFNSNDSSNVYRISSNYMLKDTYRESPNVEGVDYSFHSFGKKKKSDREKIDYIFASPDIEVKSVSIPEEHSLDGVYISDHNPVICMMVIKKVVTSNMNIDDILEVLGGINNESYQTLNKILKSLQRHGVLQFDENALEALYKALSN